jgi:hypothetical protein
MDRTDARIAKTRWKNWRIFRFATTCAFARCILFSSGWNQSVLRAIELQRLALIAFFGAVFVLLNPLVSPLRAQTPSSTSEEIKPPFGLQWGESSDRLERLLKGAKAQIVDKHTIEGRDAWTVEGLLQQGLKRTVFYFRSGQLVEVELQYQSPDWDSAKYNDFMAQVRRRIEQRFGTGQLIARTKGPEGDVTQTIVGYKWNLNNTAIQLFYYCAERNTDSYRTVSVHYKTL